MVRFRLASIPDAGDEAAEGARRGCDHAILQASPAGQPVYETMGFTHLGNYTQLEGPPTADA